MFAKMLADSRAFLVSAVAAWDRAHTLAAEASAAAAARRKRDAASGALTLTMDHEDFGVESALTSATFNYVVALELQIKAFVGVARRFDALSVSAMESKIGHKIARALDPRWIPPDWKERLEAIYRDQDMSRTEVQPYYDVWNPPTGEWIGDTKRLEAPTLRSFLEFLSREGAPQDRYSFQDVAEDDWRIKLAGYERIGPFHTAVEEFLIAKAIERGCWSEPVSMVLTLDEATGGSSLKPLNVIFRTPKARFEFEKALHRPRQPSADS